MSQSRFKYYPLELVTPSFDSTLTRLILDLEHLRKITLRGTTPASTFLQLKDIFHLLESIGSARIEGNNTTLAEYIEGKIDHDPHKRENENIKEIQNIEETLDYIDEYLASSYPINETFVKNIHHSVVEGLSKEGDRKSGTYRSHNVRIANADHIPPDSILVPMYMQELFDFLNHDDPTQFDLIKIALAHHRFVWIHPFGNGNGRTVRLFTYALLLQYGFRVERIINPTAVFCNNRELYYQHLAQADQGDPNGLLSWCAYVLSGLKLEMEKLYKLCNYDYVKQSILSPALSNAKEVGLLNLEEYDILSLAIELQEIQNSDISKLLSSGNTSVTSRKIRQLVDKKMLMPTTEGKRKYTLRFDNNYLIRSIMRALDHEGFLPMKYD